MAAAATKQDGGPFGFLADGFEAVLKVLDEGLEKLGVPYSYGFAIILITILVKAATFPLSQKQVQSTLALQALQPRVKDLQAKYPNDPETLQIETARLYRDAGVNPLAGCLPTLATIPVFIGLYRALTNAAADGLLDSSSFFWIPSLAGPTSITDRQAGAGLNWLFPFVDGAPPVGWHDAACYLVLPVLLVVSQYISQKVISPQSGQDQSQQQANAILKFLPLMIGWFSLNVPSGLTLYWFVNNLLSTAQQIYLKRSMVAAPAAAGGVGALSEQEQPVGTIIKPREDRSKQLTGKELGSRKKRRNEDVIDVEAGQADAASMAASAPRNSRGQKFRATKAREAASRAAGLSGMDGTSAHAAESEPIKSRVATEEKLQVPDAPPQK